MTNTTYISSKQYPTDFVKRRVMLGQEYARKFGKITDVKHFQKWMKEQENQLKLEATK